VEARAQIGGILKGLLFIPFHYGYWDTDDDEHKRAANELTLTSYDPVSKQPHFKFAAVKIDKLK
jgi:anaerobic selenocysteine-containing dehydrogenase